MKGVTVERLPVVVIGAGPVGLAAAAHLATRGMPFLVLEAGRHVGHAIRQWGHVRLFSPWRYNLDRAARDLLDRIGWQPPVPDELPSGRDLIDRYLEPLAAHPAIAPHLRLNARVVSAGRKDFDKVRTAGRDRQPFELRLADGSTVAARAVIDASGTWFSPNPMGAGGRPAHGEREAAERIAYGIPDVLGSDRSRFAGRKVLVVGSGHSAINTVLDLLTLKQAVPETSVEWAMRRDDVAPVFGGEAADALPARGSLGMAARKAVEADMVRLLRPLRIRDVGAEGGALAVSGLLGGHPFTTKADEIVVATGFRPDLDMLREVRLDLDPWLESARALGSLIDPNLHGCGTVRAHGARELTHPEKDFFVAGAKSYGRAPTFLMVTGHEQVRSIVAALDGDHEAAGRVELDLPETGVCGVPGSEGGGCCGPAPEEKSPQRAAAASGQAGGRSSEAKKEKEMKTQAPTNSCCGPAPAAATAAPEPVQQPSGCCGGPAPQGTDACCVKDADAKAAGEAGCGCSAAA